MSKDYYEAAQTFVQGRIQKMDAYFDEWKPIFDADYDHYFSRPPPQRNPNDSNIFVPRTREAIEAIQPRMAGEFLNVEKPYIEVVGRGPEDHSKAAAVKELLFARGQEMNLGMALLPYIKQCLILGSTVGMMAPQPGKKRIYRRRPGMTEAAGLALAKLFKNRSQQERIEAGLWEEEQEAPGSRFIPLDLYDYRIDPEATSQDDAFDEAYKTQTTLKDLRAEAAAGVSYMNLEDVKESSAQEDHKSDRRGKTATGTDPGKEGRRNVQRVEWWGPYEVKDGRYGKYKEQICRIVLANDVLVLLEANPFGNGRSPFVFGRFEFDPFEVYGCGIARALRALQKEINELRNVRINALHRMLSPMLLTKEGALVNPEEFRVWRPHGIVRVRGGVSLNDVVQPLFPTHLGSLVAALQDERQATIDIQARSSVSEYVRGLEMLSGKSETATEYTQKLAQGSIIFVYNFKVFVEESLKKIARLTLEHDQQSMSRARVLRVIGEEKAESWLTIQPGEIQGMFDFFPVVDPSQKMETAARSLMVQMMQIFLNADAMLRERGEEVNWKGLLHGIAESARIRLPGDQPLIVSIPPERLAAMEVEKAIQQRLAAGAAAKKGGFAQAGGLPGEMPMNAPINDAKGEANKAAMGGGLV